MKNCAKKGCDKQATHTPVMRCWADTDSYGPHQPIETTMDLQLCEEHGHQFIEEQAELLRDAAKKVDAAGRAMGRAPIDHDRTKVDLVRLQ